ncbi:unnamed protein product [Calicophoron daubneyi]|uniref:Rubicon Homology domain-containing protein n=1 Tax=Calicophoron daubneyi TaxID=300641 RepID=A0AAV2T1K4_CALDB
MSKSRNPIKVLSGMYMPISQCADLPAGSIPMGEEVTEDELPDSPLSDISDLLTKSPLASKTPSVKPRNSTITTSTDQAALFSACSILAAKLKKMTTEEIPQPPVRPSITSAVPVRNALRNRELHFEHTCCHHQNKDHKLRAVSVGHLGCLIRALMKTSEQSSRNKKCAKSYENLMTSRLNKQCVPDLALPSSLCVKTNEDEAESRPCDKMPLIQSDAEPSELSIPQSRVVWLDNPAGGEVNRKAVFSLGGSPKSKDFSHSRSDCANNVNSIVTGQHLLLPGRSEFEDELVREVAYFELSEYIIGEIEVANALALCSFTTTRPELQCSFDLQANRTGSLDSVHQRRKSNTTGSKSGKSNLWRSRSNCGFLTFGNPQEKSTLRSSSAAVLYPTKADGPSAFSDFFGIVQQGLFVDSEPSETSSTQSTDCSTAHCKPSRSVLNSSSIDSTGGLPQIKSVASFAVDVINSRLASLPGQPSNSLCVSFLNDLKRVVAQTGDADWAFWDQAVDFRLKSAMRAPPLPVGQLLASVYPDVLYTPLSSPLCRSMQSAPLTESLLPIRNRSSTRLRSYSGTISAQLTKSEKKNGPVCPENVSHPRDTLPTLFSNRSNQSDPGGASAKLLPNNEPEQRSTPAVDHNSDPNFATLRPKTEIFDNCETISAICTPLSYELLKNPPLPKSKRKSVLLSQHNRCAGCGTFIETRYIKRMRFCEFFGKYFCCVCHTNTLMILPGNVLSNWDFRMLPVSNIGRDRLNQLNSQPLLRLSDFSQQVVQHQPNLRSCATIRKQGNLILPFVRFCSDAQNVVATLGALPKHWLETPDLWSMADLCAVRDGHLEAHLRSTLQPIVDHLTKCPRCRAQGFICELCHSGQVLFPFGQLNTVTCPACMACFHRSCLRNPKPENCPRCIRRAMRRRRQQSQLERDADQEY